MIKVLLVDDHQMMLDGLEAFLSKEKDIQLVDRLLSAEEAISLLEKEVPDILITDIQMKEMDGVELCKYVKQNYPKVKVLALTMFIEQAYIKGMLSAGASGYILKNADREEFISAIRAVHKTGKYLSQEVMNALVDSYRSSEREFGKKLSKREIEIIQMIANELTTRQIAEQLHLSPLTIKTHRKNILQKLGVKNTAGLIKYAVQNGLID